MNLWFTFPLKTWLWLYYDKSITEMTCQFFSLNNDINARQPETRAIMNWPREIQFAASASLHGVILHLLFPLLWTWWKSYTHTLLFWKKIISSTCCDSIKIKFSIHMRRDEDLMGTWTSAKGDEEIIWVHECLLILISTRA